MGLVYWFDGGCKIVKYAFFLLKFTAPLKFAALGRIRFTPEYDPVYDILISKIILVCLCIIYVYLWKCMRKCSYLIE